MKLSLAKQKQTFFIFNNTISSSTWFTTMQWHEKKQISIVNCAKSFVILLWFAIQAFTLDHTCSWYFRLPLYNSMKFAWNRTQFDFAFHEIKKFYYPHEHVTFSKYISTYMILAHNVRARIGIVQNFTQSAHQYEVWWDFLMRQCESLKQAHWKCLGDE